MYVMRTLNQTSPTMFAATTKSCPLFSLRSTSLLSSKPNFQNFVHFIKGSSSPAQFTIGLTNKPRNFSVSCSSQSKYGSQISSIQENETFFRGVLESMQSVYLNRNPTAKAILDLVHSLESNSLCYDHFAFRTFGVNGHGIDTMASFFLDYGYTQREELRFPAKKLRALWFSPPNDSVVGNGTGVNGPLPRIFTSELLVDQMSPKSQEIIRKYTKSSGDGNKYAALASSLGHLTWEKPLYSEFQQLASESEYAAWTLVNGYALNHVTISTHRLKTQLKDIKHLNKFIEDSGFRLNSEGGVLKEQMDVVILKLNTIITSCSTL